MHVGLATESLIETLLNAAPENAHVMDLPWSDADRNLLASILMKEDEELTAERLEAAVRALRRIQLRHKLEQVQRELQASRGQESSRLEGLLQEKVRLKRALMRPGLVDGEAVAAPERAREP